MTLRRTLAVCALLSLTLLGPGASAQDDAFLVGKWVVSSVATGDRLTDITLSDDHKYQGGAWGRNYGGPNGLGATRYKFEGGILSFFYPHEGRKPDTMLEGRLTPDSEVQNQYDFEVTGGYYGANETRGQPVPFTPSDHQETRTPARHS